MICLMASVWALKTHFEPFSTYDLLARAELLQQAIATLQLQIQQIKATGEVAPPGCYVLRYQARGNRGTYWYYKLSLVSTP